MSRNTRAPIHPIDDRRQGAKTRPHAIHHRNPPGTKMLKRFYRAKHGCKPGNIKELLAWWRSFNPTPPRRAAHQPDHQTSQGATS